MFKKKKAQGLSLNTVIIAAIVLIVLVVLVMVFTGRMGGFTSGISDQTEKTCKEAGGKDDNGCAPDKCPLQNRVILPVEMPDGKVCCKEPCST